MPTAPRLPEDEAPLDRETLERLLSSLDTDTVLVGGQALAFWMHRYGVDAGRASISIDADVLGNASRAHDIARRLRASVLMPARNVLTSLVAQIRVPAEDGKVRNIDVLHLLYTVSGLRKSSEFTKRVMHRSVDVEWRKGKMIRVMHPLDVLESRVQNAAGLLEEKGPHVLTQARWAIEMARLAILRVAHAREPSDDRLGQLIQEVYRLAHSRPGRKLQKEHAIEVLDAIDVKAMSTAVRTGHAEQLERVEAARKARTPGSGRSA